MQNHTKTRRSVFDVKQQVDLWLLAMTFVISRRQMRGKWNSRLMHRPA